MRDDLDFRLLNGFQRDLPLTQRPFAAMATSLGVDEAGVIDRLASLRAQGRISRVGAVFAPGTLGAATLAAMAVPHERLEEVAALVSARPAVNHNYEREHRLNLWFVATAATPEALDAELAAITRDTGIDIVRLPLIEEYHIDLGFDLGPGQERAAPPRRPATRVSGATERRLAAALEDGLELVPRPFAALAARADMEEAACLERLGQWQEQGVVRRLGVIVRHRELGFVANAMAVWDVPDADAATIGHRLAGLPGVNLCYRRARQLPHWPYNLFCMMHGRHRHEVEARLESAAREAGLEARPHAVLFSTRRFKQTGARYLAAPPVPEDTTHG